MEQKSVEQSALPVTEKGRNGTDQQRQGERKSHLRPQQIRRLITKYSAAIVILIPTLVATLYYSLAASDQFAVEVRFAVRGVSSAGNGSDILSMVTGMSSNGSTAADSYILMDYIQSRELLERLQRKIGLHSIYGYDKGDFFSAFDAKSPIEDLVKYWKRMTTISYDTSSQIIVLEVRAFTREDAKLVAQNILELSEELINELSVRSRNDTVKLAEFEVERMERRVRERRQAVRTFREKELIIDPSKTAEARIGILSHLETELATEKAKLNSLIQFMEKDSPRVKVVVGRIEALEEQLQAERAKLGAVKSDHTQKNGQLAGLLEDYQILLTDQGFAEKAYLSTLSALEVARIEATRRERYLATFVKPSLPEMALYPARVLNIFLTLAVAVMFWAIGTLIVYSVRDHIT